MDETKKAVRAIMYRRLDGQIEELQAYVEHLEEQRDEALLKVREWNKDAEIQQAEEKVKTAYRQLSKGFAPDDEQWNKIHEWEERHTKKHHKSPKVDYPTKKRLNGPNFDYRFEYTHLGTLGEVVCTVCERKAMRNSLGNETKFEELREKYGAGFLFGEV